MRVLIFHGYLLGGTGSNVYNARLAEALVRLGHEVHLLSQERHPEEHPFLAAAGDWSGGSLRVRPLPSAAGAAGSARSGGRATLYRPDIGDLLPVYVADRYEGMRARTFAECSDEEVERYIAANVAAVREVSELVAPDVALANHLVMGPVILARALRGEVPYAVKVHGSALEYTVKPDPGRFLGLAREGLRGARAVLVGSRHTAESLWQALELEDLPARTRLGPPGVDVARFTPREQDGAAEGVRALSRRLSVLEPAAAGERRGSSFDRDPLAASSALGQLAPEGEAIVAYVGKLIVSKGVDLLIAAFPHVLEREPRARLLIVGFGAYRDGLAGLVAALAAGDLPRALELARAGRAIESAEAAPAPLRLLLAHLEGLGGERLESYLRAARRLDERVLFTGRLDHADLAELLPACAAIVVPSTFPEAFGMVAAEAAACGTFPVSAGHSGLAEVSRELAAAVPSRAAPWLSFDLAGDPVSELAEHLCGWLGAEPELRARTREGLVATVRERWSWEGVASGVLAAAQGQLAGLRSP